MSQNVYILVLIVAYMIFSSLALEFAQGNPFIYWSVFVLTIAMGANIWANLEDYHDSR
jgi:hypothetical protein